MSRTLEDVLFGDLGHKAQAVTRVVSVAAAAALFLLLAGVVYRFHAAGQFEGRLWEFFAWPTTWAFLGKGLLGTLASAAAAAVIALVLGLVLLVGRLSRLRVFRWPAVAAHAAEGHDPGGDVVPWWDLPTIAGAGALRSSLDDMMKYLAANMDPPATALGRAIAVSHSPRFTVNNALRLGLNWHLSTIQGDTLIWHNGGTGGFRTILAWNPRTKVGAVLLGTSALDNEDILRHILSGLPLANIVVRKEIALPAARLADYVGRYRLAPQFAIDVSTENGKLFAQPTSQPRFQLYAEADDKFFLKVVDAQLEFARDSTGKVTSLTLVQNGARNRGNREPTSAANTTP